MLTYVELSSQVSSSGVHIRTLNIGQGDKVGSVKEKDNGYLSVA